MQTTQMTMDETRKTACNRKWKKESGIKKPERNKVQMQTYVENEVMQ